jgi:hypothetical protein
MEVVKELKMNLLSNWVDQLFVNVPLFGLKFSVADASVIGAIALTIISIWFFYCLRRENHMIGVTLRLAQNESQDIKSYIYYGICGQQVFGTQTTNDDPIRSLGGQDSRTFVGLRTITALLFFAPVLALVIVLVSDVLSLVYFSAVFRGVETTLLKYYEENGGFYEVLPRFAITIGLELVVCCLVFFLLWKAYDFQQGTAEVLREVSDKGWSKR